MKILQIVLGVMGVLVGCFTVVTAIMYLNGSIDNLVICMIGCAFCVVFNCCNCLFMIFRKKK